MATDLRVPDEKFLQPGALQEEKKEEKGREGLGHKYEISAWGGG
jgi:hypothetical protein